MAGLGRKVFATEVLTSADVQGYLQDQAVMNFGGTAARAAALPSPSEGMVTYVGGGTVQVYDGSEWINVGSRDADFSNTATGTYTDNGVDYKYVTFTASGTLTVTREGTADVLIIGGGGGVTAVSGMGGGQGGNVLSGRIFLTAASHTVTVGGGGSGSSLAVGGTTYTANAGSNGGAQYPGNSSTPNAYVDISGVGGASGGLGGGFSGQAGGAGGRGLKTEITNSTQTLAGGGGGGSGGGGGAAGAGRYGGGNGGENGVQNPTNGSANTGGGGGGAGAGQSVNTNGGSGIVIVRVKV